MNRDLRLALLGVAVFLVGMVLGDLGDPRADAPCKEGTGVPGHSCEPVPESAGLLFLGEALIVAGLFMVVVAAVRFGLGRWRGPDGG
ncbi:MAG TPA: hypothetical protein VI796_00425 [Candidatus Thermoplasmatota archaeon]|nr:hypothetical protein [Candidatus Thermoplasmatota archaeon]